jgi:hypothetical protein
MRKLFLVIVLCLLFVPIIAPSVSASGGSWTVSSKPAFAFSGDTINVTVTNSGSDRYGFVQLVAANTSTYAEEFFTLDDMGTYYFDLIIPYWLKSGDYTLSVVAGGVYVANTTLNVTLDQLVYREYLDQLTNERIAKAEQRIVYQNQLIMQEIKLREDSMLILEVAAGVVVLCAVFMAWQFKGYVEWKLSNYRGKMPLVKGWKLLTHLPPEGDHAPHMEGAGSIRQKVLAERRILEHAQVQEQVEAEPVPVVVPKKVVITKKVVTRPVIKQEADEWDLSELPRKLDLLSERPTEPEEDLTQPLVLPWNASRELEEELHQKVALQKRKLIIEMRPKAVVKDAPVTPKKRAKRAKKPLFRKLEPEAAP